ncbi:MAG: hypothetical protein NTY01_25120 [Verrucomicrobia bacterium]|nr:hypothetical protein [Verrucomicrobiota bacterium]
MVIWSYTRRVAKQVKLAQNGTFPSDARPAPMPIMFASATPMFRKFAGCCFDTVGLVPEALLRSASRHTTFGFCSMSSFSVSPYTKRISML